MNRLSRVPHASRAPRPYGLPLAFTLMEIVLAIGLTSVVMYLLMTAIELYMVRVDSSRSRVESAQLARTILDQMAADIAATRLYAPQSQGMGGGGGFTSGGGGGNGQNGGGSGQGGQSGGNQNGAGGGFGGGTNSGGGTSNYGGSGSSSSSSTLPPTEVQGVFGEVDQLRIDRSAVPNWQRAARQVMPEEPATAADMPMSVRYFVSDGDRQTSQELALEGVSEGPTTDTRAGLYREVFTTATATGESDPLATSIEREAARLELLAPEVVKMELAYFDGINLIDTWDSFEEGALPSGIEIRLTIYEPSLAKALETRPQVRTTGQPRYQSKELVEYRRFVRLPSITPPQAAEALLPVAGSEGGGQPGRGGPGGGNNGPGQGGNNGGQGGNGGGNNNGGGDDND